MVVRIALFLCRFLSSASLAVAFSGMVVVFCGFFFSELSMMGIAMSGVAIFMTLSVQLILYLFEKNYG